jgi:hypothetical protein
MMGRCRCWFLVLLVGVIAVLARPNVAMADTTTPTIAMATSMPISRSSYRAGSESSTDATYKYTITRADCRDTSLKYTFKLTISNWVGGSGTFLAARAGRASSDCASLFLTSLGSVNQFCWSLNENITIDTNGTTATASAVFTPQQLFGVGQTSGQPILQTCDDQDTTFAGQQTFGLYFVLYQAGTVLSSAKQSLYYALQGPTPPTTVNVGVADSALHVSWSGTPSVTGDITYNFYCSPNEGSESDGDCASSALVAAGAGSATSSTTSDTTTSDSSGGSTGSGGTSSTGSGGTSSTTTSAKGGATDGTNAADSLDTGAGSAGAASLTTSAGTTSNSNGGTTTVLASGGSATTGGNSSTLSTGGSTSSSAGGATSTATTGGTTSSGGSSTTSSVTSTSTTAYADPSTYFCGHRVGKTNSNGYTDSVLTNETSYAVSVAIVDRYGNVGTLSAPVCATPTKVNTFFDHYVSEGGKAGGGFCNIDLRRTGNAIPTGLASLLLVGLVRRRLRAARQRRERPISNS